jgi:hypothetical protein
MILGGPAAAREMERSDVELSPDWKETLPSELTTMGFAVKGKREGENEHAEVVVAERNHVSGRGQRRVVATLDGVKTVGGGDAGSRLEADHAARQVEQIAAADDAVGIVHNDKVADIPGSGRAAGGGSERPGQGSFTGQLGSLVEGQLLVGLQGV